MTEALAGGIVDQREPAVHNEFTAEGTVRLPPSRAKRASASLAEACGGGGKPDTYSHRPQRHGGTETILDIFSVAPRLRGPSR